MATDIGPSERCYKCHRAAQVDNFCPDDGHRIGVFKDDKYRSICQSCRRGIWYSDRFCQFCGAYHGGNLRREMERRDRR